MKKNSQKQNKIRPFTYKTKHGSRNRVPQNAKKKRTWLQFAQGEIKMKRRNETLSLRGWGFDNWRLIGEGVVIKYSPCGEMRQKRKQKVGASKGMGITTFLCLCFFPLIN